MDHHDVVNEIAAALDKAEQPIFAECCIYKVPYDIRKSNEDIFTPRVVSIGPFHYGNHRLQNLENYKLVYLKYFSKRVSESTSLDELINSVEEVEPIVRGCFLDQVQLTSKEFVKVILRDSCFLFELFLRSYYRDWSQDDDIHLKPWLVSIRVDLFLFENQLPFLILERLYHIAVPTTRGLPSFLQLTFNYFDYYNSLKLTTHDVAGVIIIRHFTDLIRTFHLQPLGKRPIRVDKPLVHLQSATELTNAGVRFRKSLRPCLIDIKVSEQVLEIPPLGVDYWTETLLRNLVALEHCYYPSESYIIDYVAVMDFLINTSKDVDVLVQNEVIRNGLGDTESVANLFNSLRTNVTHVGFNSYYLELCKELDGFCKHPWYKLKASFMRDYGSTPWQTAASIAGIVLLVLSLIQTVCSILQVL